MRRLKSKYNNKMKSIQNTTIKGILKKYKMENCNPISIPMEPGAKLSKFDGGELVDASRYQSLVGILRSLTCTRSNLSLSVGINSRRNRFTHIGRR